MKIVTIGGLPAAGKTYTSKLLAKQHNCISLEYEALRWVFFNNDLNLNLYKYTKHEPLLQYESMREYYLRCTLYENKVTFDDLVEWHKNTMCFINIKICDTINEFSLIKGKNDYEHFCKKYRDLINYMPEFQILNKELIICSHAFINTIEFEESQRIRIDFNSDPNVLIKRFKNREVITEDLAENLTENLTTYYASYNEVLKTSNAIILDTNNQNIYMEISNILSNK